MRAVFVALLFTIAPAAETGAADRNAPTSLAASIPKLDATQRLEKGQVVGLFGGGLSLSTAGAGRALVVDISDGAAEGAATTGMSRVALTGRVSVNVVGSVRSGQLLIASGRNDGSAQAVAASRATLGQLGLLVGRALESRSGEGVGSVSALVGLPEHELFSGLLEERDALLEAQEVELVELRTRVSKLEPLRTQVAELRRQTDQLMALERARASEQLAPPDRPR